MMSINDCIKAFLHAQNCFDLPTYVTAISMAFNAVLCYVFIMVMDMNVLGAALAVNATEAIRLTLMLGTIKYKKMCKETWKGWSRRALEGWSSFLKVSFGMGAIIYLEWLGFELYTFQAGRLKSDVQLAAQVILENFYVCAF
jgi:MATE family multidrug resistance protein